MASQKEKITAKKPAQNKSKQKILTKSKVNIVKLI